ncbi:diaminopimelate epimerase, partial [Schaalia turicensis]
MTALRPSTRIAKAHGTGNSFVVYTDADDTNDIDAVEVRRLCSPAFGIGADGLMRAVMKDGRWFMDYRNSDGSIAEMCGNGIRVFVDHLRREGLITDEEIEVGTRGGVRTVRVIDQGGEAEVLYRVDMGPARSSGTADIDVTIPGIEQTLRGVYVDMPNPHTVVALASEEELHNIIFPATDASEAPEVMRPTYAPSNERGTNLEAVVDLTGPEDQSGHIRLRVLERGVGETLACGTGCCAAALATAIRRGEGAPSSWIVDVPGGRVWVDLDDVLSWENGQ